MLLAALNTDPPEADAALAAAVIRETLMVGGHACRPLIARDGLFTPEELQEQNAIVRSAADILHVDFSPKGTPQQWARIIQDLERD